ncbi:MAG: TolB family protein, partial [Geminicoccaceae bacterium]
MSRIDAALGVLDRLRYPFDLSFRHTGEGLAVAVRPAAREPERSFESRIWLIGMDGSAHQITHGPGSDASPRFAPADGRLAFASDRAMPGRMSLYILEQKGEPQPLGDVPGSLEDAQWSADGATVFVLAADRGLDVAATDGAVRLWWGDPPDPEVSRPGEARRRLYRVRAVDGATLEVGPEAFSVWQFELVGDDRAVALVSADPSERGWYRA